MPNIAIKRSTLALLKKFTYLGSTISNDDCLDNELYPHREGINHVRSVEIPSLNKLTSVPQS